MTRPAEVLEMTRIIRKIIVAMLAASLLLSAALTFTVSASERGGYLGDVPGTTETIVIDGEMDDIYQYGLNVEIKYEKDRPVKATGTAKLLYSGGKLYVFAKVMDEDVRDPDQEMRESSPWRTDSFEVFINLDNDDNVYAVKQYRTDNGGWPSVYDQNGLKAYGPSAADKYFEYAAKKDVSGYCVEVAIPVDAEGKDIGVNFQINDVNTSAEELTWAMVYSEAVGGGTDSWSVAVYPYLSLAAYSRATSGGLEVDATPTPEGYTPEPADEPTADPDDAGDGQNNEAKPERKGASPIVIALICAAAARVGAAIVIVIILSKKKKSKGK